MWPVCELRHMHVTVTVNIKLLHPVHIGQLNSQFDILRQFFEVWMQCLHVFVTHSFINQHGVGRVKVPTVLSCLLTISVSLAFSCNHRDTLHSSLSLSDPVSLCFSNWCAASTHQLSGEGPIAEL